MYRKQDDDRFKALREKAETRAQEKSLQLQDLSTLETWKLVHDLQVHQIELEIQNEELRQAQEELEKSRDRFLRLFHQAPVGYLVLDRVGIIRQANDTFCTMLSRAPEKVKEKPLASFIPFPDRKVFLSRYPAFFKSPRSKSMELCLQPQGQPAFYALLEGLQAGARSGFSPEEDHDHLLLTVRDITRQREAEQKIKDYTRRLEQKGAELEELNRQLDQEIDKARHIHERTLPACLPRVKGISMAAHYQPAKKLGGDFYNIIHTGNKLVIYLSDVTGHGLDGAMLSVLVKNTINCYVSLSPPENITPQDILGFLARHYQQENYPEEYFICIFLAVLDLETREMMYSGAGFHNEVLVEKSPGERLTLEAPGLPLTTNLPLELLRLEPGYIKLDPGTTLLLTTDGLTEQVSAGRPYYERLPGVFFTHGSLPPEAILQAINQDFFHFNHKSLQGRDDITFLILQVEPEDKEEYCLEIYSSFNQLPQLRQHISQVIPSLEEKDLFINCLHELVANAVEHGNQLDPAKKVTIHLMKASRYLYVTVKDQGRGFNWRERINSRLELAGEKERGRGIALTLLCCKRLYYNERGNKATLVYCQD